MKRVTFLIFCVFLSFIAYSDLKDFYTIVINDHNTTETIAGSVVEFYVEIYLPPETITGIEWDFTGNGKNLYTTGSAYARYLYSEPGTYFPIVRVTDNTGQIYSTYTKVCVSEFSLEAVFGKLDSNITYKPAFFSIIEKYITNWKIPDSLPEGALTELKIFPVPVPEVENMLAINKLRLPSMYLQSSDGTQDLYAIILAYDSTDGWPAVCNWYTYLTETCSALPENVIVLITHDPENMANSEIIDGVADFITVSNSFNYCANTMDGDDLFLFVADVHGNGYKGYIEGCYNNMAYHSTLYEGISVSGLGDELDYKEKDFKYGIMCGYGPLDGTDYHYGVNEWGVVIDYVSNYYKREMIKSHFTDIEIENTGFISDNDVYFEKLIDYLEGDTNKDGYIDANEMVSTDGDTQQPYENGVFDEDDWGKIDEYEDNVSIWSSLLKTHDFSKIHTPLSKIPHTIFDANLDNHADIDIFPTDILEIDGTDIDNNGIIDGFDLNDDGDMDDWLTINETLSGYYDHYFLDDDIKVFFNRLPKSAKKVAIINSCYGGGLIDDLSDVNTVIMTGSSDEASSLSGLILNSVLNALTVKAAESDKNANGYVSMNEAFTYARNHTIPGQLAMPYTGYDFFCYNDRGDGKIYSNSLLGSPGYNMYFTAPDNTPPVLVSSPIVTAYAGKPYTCTFVVEDEDPDEVIIYKSLKTPFWTEFTDNSDGTAVLTGTPPANQTGSFIVAILVEDSFKNTIRSDFIINVLIE